ncbi:hypothetical protein ASPWEDRAFT_166186 [Aspergillus wentii DTO 134E9]|uniref:Fucose-specific lectin n=1 Tax=Aspergillus wentii DTO 134E9 TaxID=1073089 RepID=A0A1L9RYQ7_ASPWE|nr:uncharacterized protein ASPWEDRAFT_166186 [Aspergillus wentii DTO 134E9]KAI9932534.1 hypothetical protein MW887_008776 [Aspergillus wentii]OJJ40100.1 hypothetical protein ASPWEDRAFT_166186 [Aspergillus wentii DTO 134E9]
MSGLASVANPLDPNPTAIQVYYATQDKNLAMQFKPSGATRINPGVYHPAANDYPGYISSPSHLAVGYFQGAQFVVGYTKPKTTELKPKGTGEADSTDGNSDRAETENISIISPVYEPIIFGVGLGKRALTFTANNDIASIWYLNKDDKNRIVLQEYKLNERIPANDAKMSNIDPSSSLAGYIAGDDVFVIYQTPAKDLFEYKSGEDWSQIGTVAAPAPQTTLAVNYVEEKKTAYLYYRTEKGELYRMARKVDGKWSDTKKINTKSVAVGPTSQLAVVYSNGINHIYWVPEKRKDPMAATDDLK